MSRLVEHNRHHRSPVLLDKSRTPGHRRSWAAHLGGGMIIGVGIGLAARAFMRLLTADPDFTWSGMIFIVGLFAVFGTVQGGVAAITSRTTRRWITIPVRLVGGLSYLLLGGGAGLLMVPFLWFGALACWRTTWHRWLRTTLAVLAAANIAAVVGLTLSEDGSDRLRELGVLAGFALFAATYIVAVWTAGPTFRSAPTQPAMRHRDRRSRRGAHSALGHGALGDLHEVARRILLTIEHRYIRIRL